MMRRFWLGMVSAAVVGLLASAASAGWFSDERPPAGAKPLSEIVKALEDQGMASITEIEFEDGVWKVEVHQPDGREVEIKIDPTTGQIKSRK